MRQAENKINNSCLHLLNYRNWTYMLCISKYLTKTIITVTILWLVVYPYKHGMNYNQ